MKLDDFLKVKQARCVKGYGRHLTAGKTYPVLGLSIPNNLIQVENDNGFITEYDFEKFEPVLDSAENPLQNIELTPEFEAVEPKFKVGDPVYLPNRAGGKILKIQDNKACHYPFFVDVVNSVNNSLYEIDRNGKTKYGNFTDVVIKATPENYELLCKLYPHIEFEQPAKELTGSDLARAMLEKGWKYVPCYVHDGSDDEAINRKHYVSVKNETPRSGYNFSGTGANDWKYAVPIDPRTGEPLTQAVLDE
jgi:hypothetical protein